jgi:hypothetical protein
MAAPRRLWGLVFGVGYMAVGLLAGLNIDTLWDMFAPEGASAGVRHNLSTLAVVFPHTFVVAGLILLMAASRLSKRAFIAVALLPAAYAALWFVLRAQY